MSDEPLRRLEELAPEAATNILAIYINWSKGELEKDPGEAILAAYSHLPDTGPITRNDDKRIAQALSWFIDEVPLDHPDREEIKAAVADAVERAK